MCRSIKTLFNFQPPATDEAIRAASLQFVRKLSGYHKPPQGNIGGDFEDLAGFPADPRACAQIASRKVRRLKRAARSI